MILLSCFLDFTLKMSTLRLISFQFVFHEIFYKNKQSGCYLTKKWLIKQQIKWANPDYFLQHTSQTIFFFHLFSLKNRRHQLLCFSLSALIPVPCPAMWTRTCIIYQLHRLPLGVLKQNVHLFSNCFVNQQDLFPSELLNLGNLAKRNILKAERFLHACV